MSVRLGGNWGTSTLTVFPLAGGEARRGPGIAKLERADMISRLKPLMQDECQIIMCGMVGSTIGLREAPYAKTPAGLDELATKIIWHEEAGLRIGIVPGIRCDRTDVMRGEETELMGWLSAGHTQGLVCIPGTHTKWVRVEGGAVQEFSTALTGELFAVLEQHSVLVGAVDQRNDETAFLQGVAVAREQGANLLRQLFLTRARQLLDGLAPECASSFLSGLLIGHDIAAANCGQQDVHLIASDRLTKLYRLAFGAFGNRVYATPSLVASRIGLNALLERNLG